MAPILLAVVVVAGLPRSIAAGAAPSSPTVSAYASSGWWVGVPIFASANLRGGLNPTGTLTFSLYGPGDASCSGSPMFISSVAVSGDGYYRSASFATDTAGTYHWTAAYSGDANNTPTAPSACNDPATTAWVAMRNVTLHASASTVSETGSVTNTATLGAGVNPTGVITFRLFGPDNLLCAGTPIFTSVKAVTGNGTYTSDPFVPTSPGRYQWKVAYSGDSNNAKAFTICSDGANFLTVAPALPTTPAPPPPTTAPTTTTTTPTTTTTAAPTTTTTRMSVAPTVVTPVSDVTVTAVPSRVRPGDELTVSWSGLERATSGDWVALYAVGAPGWAVVTWSYTTGTASGSVRVTVPPETSPGQYEFRLRTAKSAALTVVTVS